MWWKGGWHTEWNQPGGTFKIPQTGGDARVRSPERSRDQEKWLDVGHHRLPDAHTSPSSSRPALKTFHREEWDIYDFLSGDTFALFSFLLCNHTNCFHIWLLAYFTAQKDFSEILIWKGSQTGVRFGFLKHRRYDFIVIRAAAGVFKGTNRKKELTGQMQAFKRNLWGW